MSVARLALLTLLCSSTQAWALPQAPHDLAAGIGCPDCHVPFGGFSGATNSTSTSGTTQSLTDSTMSWTTDQWVGGSVSFAAGAITGEFRLITANTSDTISWDTPLAGVAGGQAYALSVVTEYDIETQCKTCHNPLGMAASMSDVAMHRITGFERIGCGKCHDPHNNDPNTGQGAGLIRYDLRWGSSSEPVVWPMPGLSDYVRIGAPYDGICETCHTKTMHHRNSSDGDHSHQVVTDCQTCHEHQEGFTFDCLSCHDQPRDNGDNLPVGGRRAVLLEFPFADLAHAHANQASLGEATCRICHDMSGHREGEVQLIDPDDGTTLSFVEVADVTSDPDISDFCMGCHDDDGATRLALPFDPWGNGNAPPDVASQFQGTLQWNEWFGDGCFGENGTLRGVNSHHDISDADQAFSGAKLECLSCHGAHNVSESNPLGDPWDVNTLYTGTDNEFCIECHNGGTGPTSPGFPPGVSGPDAALTPMDSCDYTAAPWWTDYTFANSAHGPDSKRGWGGYSGALSFDMNCIDCHDQHGSWTPSNTAGNPYSIRDYVDGTMYVDDGARDLGFNGPPFNTYGTARAVEVSVSGLDVGWGDANGLCEACHVDWVDAMWAHASCTSCQFCHGHGQYWQNLDFGDAPDDSTPCP